MAGNPKAANQWLSAMRNHMGESLGLADENLLAFAFVTAFPLFEWDQEGNRWDSTHHPFTSPADGEEDLLDGNDLGNLKSKAYDLVCNGSELASGSIRIHQRRLQEKIFQILGYSEESMGQLFGQIWRRSSTARRPTVASPPASTGSWPSWPGPPRYGT